MKVVTGACKLIDGCSLELCSATLSVTGVNKKHGRYYYENWNKVDGHGIQ